MDIDADSQGWIKSIAWLADPSHRDEAIEFWSRSPVRAKKTPRPVTTIFAGSNISSQQQSLAH